MILTREYQHFSKSAEESTVPIFNFYCAVRPANLAVVYRQAKLVLVQFWWKLRSAKGPIDSIQYTVPS